MTSQSLHVIALISGGKDSLFSILHLLANGHHVVALANLHPPYVEFGRTHDLTQNVPTDTSPAQGDSDTADIENTLANTHVDRSGTLDEEQDLDSFMYQTVGHSIVPLYEEALGIPLYRRAIRGSAVNDSREYAPPSKHRSTIAPLELSAAKSGSTSPSQPEHRLPPSGNVAIGENYMHSDEADETESLIPLLQTIMASHPSANAISTGAILSTYQRTRIESVASRLGLVPLSYLWQYPYLPPYTESSLLQDMEIVGQDARIIKVASGGLDESILWANVANEKVRRRLEKAVERFGGEGAVLGEGGEFETLALDGPDVLWKKRIEVDVGEAVEGEGGSAVLKFKGAKTVEKEHDGEVTLDSLRIPPILDDELAALLSTSSATDAVKSDDVSPKASQQALPSTITSPHDSLPNTRIVIPPWRISQTGTTISISNMTLPSPSSPSAPSQLPPILSKLTHILHHLHLEPIHILQSTILLSSMPAFAAINTLYAPFFSRPLPPARITLATSLPPHTHISLSILLDARSIKHLFNAAYFQDLSASILALDAHTALPLAPLSTSPSTAAVVRDEAPKRGLHVQSRSYWAPANIGPYSQAIALPVPSTSPLRSSHAVSISPQLVHIAGQIPLVPASMLMAERDVQVALSLQHLFRVGRAMGARVFLGAVAAVASGDIVDEARRVWEGVHRRAWDVWRAEDEHDDEGEAEERFDVWDIKYGGGPGSRAGTAQKDIRAPLPDYTAIRSPLPSSANPPIPPLFTAQVTTLPRDASIEWIATALASGDTLIKSSPDGSCALDVEGTSVSVLWLPLREDGDGLRAVEKVRAYSQGETGVWTVWLADEGVGGEWIRSVGACVVPCERVWGAEGEVKGVCCVRIGA